MAQSPVIYALKGKYARLLGEAIVHEREAVRLRQMLANVEASIALFDARIIAQSIKPIRPHKPSRWGKRGGGVQIYLEILRKADRPLTSLEIATKAALLDTHADCSHASVKALVGPINRSLGLRIGKGVALIEGHPKRWALERR
jgi:hypothetical protein